MKGINRQQSLRSSIIFCLLFCIAEVAGAGFSNDTLKINTTGEYPLNRYLYFNSINGAKDFLQLNDAAHSKDFKLLYPKKSFSVGVNYKYCRIRFTVKNNLQKTLSLYFELNNPGLNIVSVYKSSPQGFVSIGKAGEHLSMNTRPVKYYDLIFPFELKPGETTTVVALIDNGGENIDCLPQLFDADFFNDKRQLYYTVNAVITGIMLTALLLNIFLAISLKNKLHCLYAAYIIAILFEMYVIQGIDVQYIYPQHPELSDIFKYISPVISLTLMAYVMQIFLQQKKNNSRVKIIVDVLKYFIIALIPLFFIIYLYFPDNSFIRGKYEQVFAIALALQLCMFFVSAIEKVIQRYKPAYFYLIAITYLWYGAIQYVITILGGSTKDQIEKQPNDLQIGIVVETLIVFSGIIYRYNLFKKENQQLSITLKNEKLKYTEQIIQTQEAERKRIAEDLHDEIGSNLAILKLKLQTNEMHDAIPDNNYNQLINIINKTSDDVRRIAHNLMPPEFNQTSLSDLIAAHIHNLNKEKEKFHLAVTGNSDAFTKEQELIIYRIILEITNNIIKHSGFTEATIQLIYYPDFFEIMAEDNGVGFSTINKQGIGLSSIKSRVAYMNGNINIDTSEFGTTIFINIPCKQNSIGDNN